MNENFLVWPYVYSAMGEPVIAGEKVTLGAKVIFILLAGALSMFFAEVCSGS